jgi:glutamate N-acetyltransferase/amino-acid N-acetyltransferase
MKKYKEFIPVNGFTASAIACGIKKGSSKKDMCLIHSAKPAHAAGVFTRNTVKAAPILISMNNISSGKIHSILVNSGNANACTGKQGMDDAKKMISLVSEAMGINTEAVLIASTGVIGVPLPMDRIVPNIKPLTQSLGISNFSDVAEAIMTTDTFKKEVSVDFMIGGKRVVISGMAKGSGMIHPDMGTMLSFILTDAAIESELLNKALSECAGVSFNMISVDGDTSTNDTAIVLANGSAGNQSICIEDPNYYIFKEALKIVCIDLAMQIAKDGEGATKLIEVNLTGGFSQEAANCLAKSIITSSLVKAAFFGNDANWGRILCAMGYSGENFDAENLDLIFEGGGKQIYIVEKGKGLDFDENLAEKILKNETVIIHVKLNDGTFSAKAWGCDLSYDYVRINGDYRS